MTPKSPNQRMRYQDHALPVRATELDGSKTTRGQVRVKPAGKAPKLRFKPGMIVEYKDDLYQIVYAFRIQEEPSEWRFYLEERKSVLRGPPDMLDQLETTLGLGSETPRVVYDLFRDAWDALKFFNDIPRKADGVVVRNKDLIQKGKVISSGEILT